MGKPRHVRLSINVNKVATLRNARGGDVPNVVEAARVAIEAGAEGITVHPRPDERHIRRRDVVDLAAAIQVELNVEGFPSPRYLSLVEEVRPTQCTLVPDPPDVLTSDAGWNLSEQGSWLREEIVPRLKALGMRVSLFLDPDAAVVEQALETGCERIELYTERYARSFQSQEREAVFERYRQAADRAVEVGLGVNAGHDLDCENLPFLVGRLPGLLEVSIGHALISRALYDGLATTVKKYLMAIKSGEADPAFR